MLPGVTGGSQNPRPLVIVPAFNEESTIGALVERTLPVADVCVVDDGSTDSTAEIVARMIGRHPKGLFLVRHPVNTHIPKAIQDGMKLAVEKDYRWVITMDAGMSHDPAVISSFMEQPECDLLIGSRRTKGGRTNAPVFRRAVSALGSRIMNYCLGEGRFDFKGPGIRDCTSGFRRYSRRAFSEIAGISLRSKAFDFHLEALDVVNRTGGSIREIPIQYNYTNSSFNLRVLRVAGTFVASLLRRKWS